MEIVTIIFLALAYTLCVATIIIQLLCYKKNIEYIETIIFTVSFLFLIITVTVSEFFDMEGKTPSRFLELMYIRNESLKMRALKTGSSCFQELYLSHFSLSVICPNLKILAE